ncbi:uncharacterized protein LOC131941294 isoform X1 [Physella acuta]|uniref:uncharacterized protein LOC131941294 isoform X1 n=1 Tax=Physella acuta TaxID=109671 RepID=UPI0027DC2E56|nr:uncharacterized protein LOC131941294 isoform X1 [Physella acuta]XP_059156465.1 uncharacterized protein LOC131941294 isoform X1 [Physella acuta]
MKIKSYLSNQVGIQFKIWCPNLNRVRHRLFLLGSLPELGAWNIDAALEAYPTPDIHVWKVEAAVPAMATFEWVWLRTAPNRTAVEWERTAKRNRTVDCFSGTVHTIWGEDDEVFHQTATCLELTTFININDGYTLVLVGSTPTTGLWNLNHAVTAKEFPKKSGYWKVNVSFDSFVNLNFKWTVVKERDHTNIKMQEKVQHSIYGRRGWMRAVAPWMQPTVVVLDTSVMADTFDDSLGRTDLVIKERKKRNKEIAEWTKTSNKMSTLPAKRLSDVLPRSRPSFSQENLRSHPGTPPILGDRPKVATLSRPSSDTNHRPQAGLLDELIQQKEKQVRSRTERFTEQLSKTYTDDVTALKGAGQTQLQFDPLNIGDLSASRLVTKLQDLTVTHSQDHLDVNRLSQDHLDVSRLSQDHLDVSRLSQEHLDVNRLSQEHLDVNRLSQEHLDVNRLSQEHLDVNRLSQEHLDVNSMESFLSSYDESDVTLVPAGKEGAYQCTVSKSLELSTSSDTGFTELTTTLRSGGTLMPQSGGHLPPALGRVYSQLMDEGFSETTLMSNVDKTIVGVSNVDKTIVEVSNVDKTIVEVSNVDKTIVEVSNVDKTIVEVSNVDKTIVEVSNVDQLAVLENSAWEQEAADLRARAETLELTAAEADDCEHAEWLARRVQAEDLYCMSTHGLGLELPPDHPFIGSQAYMSQGHLVEETLMVSADRYDVISTWDELADARMIARQLEQDWGSGANSWQSGDCGTDGCQTEVEGSQTWLDETWSVLQDCQWSDCHWSDSELNMTSPPEPSRRPPLPVDERLEAQLLEKVWGESCTGRRSPLYRQLASALCRF